MSAKEIEIQIALGTLNVNELNGTEFLYYLKLVRGRVKWPWGSSKFAKRDTTKAAQGRLVAWPHTYEYIKTRVNNESNN